MDEFQTSILISERIKYERNTYFILCTFYASHIWEKNKVKLRKCKKVNFGKDKAGKPKAVVFILFVVIHSGEDKT